MTEDFLHYLWKFQNFNKRALFTTAGEKVELVKPGFQNHHGGPDFVDTRIRIGTQLWAGNLEIHVRSSDWNKHTHQTDEAYNNVVLHVVYEHDIEVKNEANKVLPTLALKGRFDEYLYWRYEQLMQSTGGIPCKNHIRSVEPLVRESMLERVLAERISRKGEQLRKLLALNKGDWEETAYQWLSYGYGLKINADPMLWLARTLPLRILLKQAGNAPQVEALLFGTAGFLQDEGADEYSRTLFREYRFLKHKYRLRSLEKSLWNYGRLRPVAFPEMRIGYWASVLTQRIHLFQSLISIGHLPELMNYFRVKSNLYWKDHYRLGKPSKAHYNIPGKAFLENLVINVAVPFLYVYAEQTQEDFYRQRALDLLDQMPSENNKVTRLFEQFGTTAASAFDSQALLELNTRYCGLKKCLNCSIGNHILKKQV